MKKVILFAASLMISGSAFAQTNNAKSTQKFQRYLANKISYNSNFSNIENDGTVKVKINVTPQGISNVYVLNGVNDQLDRELVDLIKNTPERITHGMLTDKTFSMVMPVRFVTKEN